MPVFVADACVSVLTGPVSHDDLPIRNELFSHGTTLGANRATGDGRSPRRQVRLDTTMNARLDAYAAAMDTTPSAVIRDALDVFFNQADSRAG